MTPVLLYQIIEKMQQVKDTRDLIKEKLAVSGKSLNKIAHQAGIEPSTLCNIVNKKQGMNYKTVAQIALGFDMKLSEFIKEVEDNQYIY